jgi:hypothetical protein
MTIVVADLWHQINGKWTHIYQTFDGETTLYYTDGLQFQSPLDEVLHKL